MSYHRLALFALAVLALVTKLVRLRTKADSARSELGPTCLVLATALLSLLWVFDARGITTIGVEVLLLGLAGTSVIAAIWTTFVQTRT